MDVVESFNHFSDSVLASAEFWQEQGLTRREIAERMMRDDIQVESSAKQLIISILSEETQ